MRALRAPSQTSRTMSFDDNSMLGKSEDYSGRETSEEDIDPLTAVRGTSFLACYSSMCNTILGAGVLSLPYAFSLTGWVTGTILLSIGGIFNSTGMIAYSILQITSFV